MEGFTAKDKELTIKLDVKDLSPQQIRLLKSLSGLMTCVLTADDESEYFNFSAEFMRKAIELIKSGQFNQNQKLDYGTQAVEYALDFINDSEDDYRSGNIDN